MAAFACRSKDASGATVQKTIVAATRREAIAILHERGLTPIKIVPVEREERAEKAAGKKRAARRKWTIGRKVKLRELFRFTMQLGSTIESGVPILSGLTSIGEQTDNQAFQDVIQRMMSDIEGGLPLSGAMVKHPKVFPEVYVNSIAAGEKSGGLDDVLHDLAEYIEADMEVRSDVRSALMYPMIVIATLGVAVSVLFVFVIPRFATFYNNFKTELPLPTRIMIFSSRTISEYFIFILLGLAAIVYGFRRFHKTPRGRRLADRLILRVPVLGRVVETAITLRVVQMLGLFTRSGVPMLEGLETIAETAGNTKIKNSLRAVAESVATGETLATSMESADCLPPTARQMIASGEVTGSVEKACFSIARHYKKELKYLTKNLSTFIEPILTLVLAVIVLFVALATFLPMWNLVQLVKR